MAAIEAGTGIVCPLNLIEACRQRCVVAEIILPRRAAAPGDVKMPTRPIGNAPAVVI